MTARFRTEKHKTTEQARRLIIDTLNTHGIPALDPRDYLEIARFFACYQLAGAFYLDGRFYSSGGNVEGRFVTLRAERIEAEIYEFLGYAWAVDRDGARPFRPDSALVAEVLAAVRAVLTADARDIAEFESRGA